MKNYIYILISISIFGSGCNKILTDFEFEDRDPKLVMHTKISPDSIAKVYLTRSLDMFDRRNITPIKGATISITGVGIDETLLKEDSAGWYSVLSTAFQQGQKYTFKAIADNYPEINTEAYVPVLPEVESIDTSSHEITQTNMYYGGDQGSFRQGIITFKINDKAATEDYYIFSGSKFTSEYRYDYEFDTITYEHKEVIIDTLPPRYTEINLSTDSPYLTLYKRWDAWYKPEDARVSGDLLVFSDELFNGRTAYINLYINPQLPGPDKETVDITLTTCDKNYYQYINARANIEEAQSSLLAEPVTPFSNVDGGFGLVYGYSKKLYEIDITGMFTKEDYEKGGYHNWGYY